MLIEVLLCRVLTLADMLDKSNVVLIEVLLCRVLTLAEQRTPCWALLST